MELSYNAALLFAKFIDQCCDGADHPTCIVLLFQFLFNKQRSVVTSPVTMWLDGLDIALSRLRTHPAAAAHLPAIAGCSVSGQQHGTVYWAQGASQQLAALRSADFTTAAESARPLLTLNELLAGCFARRECPIWADSSTVKQCQQLESALGGALAVAQATGSAAYPRFSGNQIAKIAAAEADSTWARCERVSLVSSFVTSVLIGAVAPIDCADASGMNLMDISTKQWHSAALAATGASGLAEKLGTIVDSHTVVGTLCAAAAAKYGLPLSCAVVAGSGDNPNAMAAMGLTAATDKSSTSSSSSSSSSSSAAAGGQDVAVSLGTSDTAMGVTTDAPVPAIEGHIMRSALSPSACFAMLVYKNGGVTRQSVRDRYAAADWTAFAEALASSQPGNAGIIGLLLDLPEITPQTDRTGRFFATVSEPDNCMSEQQLGLNNAQIVRAVVEGRFLSMRGRLLRMGVAQPKRVLAVGGASSNKGMMQVSKSNIMYHVCWYCCSITVYSTCRTLSVVNTAVWTVLLITWCSVVLQQCLLAVYIHGVVLLRCVCSQAAAVPLTTCRVRKHSHHLC
jgi:xylulokinase